MGIVHFKQQPPSCWHLVQEAHALCYLRIEFRCDYFCEMADAATVTLLSRRQSLHREERQTVHCTRIALEYRSAKNPWKLVSWRSTGTQHHLLAWVRATVCDVRSEVGQGPLRVYNKERQCRGVRSNSRKVKYDLFRSGIRIKVHEFYFKNQQHTLRTLLTAINNDPSLPDFKRTTLYVLLKQLGFVYEKRGNKAIMI